MGEPDLHGWSLPFGLRSAPLMQLRKPCYGTRRLTVPSLLGRLYYNRDAWFSNFNCDQAVPFFDVFTTCWYQLKLTGTTYILTLLPAPIWHGG